MPEPRDVLGLAVVLLAIALFQQHRQAVQTQSALAAIGEDRDATQRQISVSGR